MAKKLIVTKPLSVTVVVPARNEADHIGSCLDALTKQTLRPDEIILVDNGSTDATAQIAESFAGVTVITEATAGTFFAQRTGFNAATSEIIARTDADSIPDPTWVSAIHDSFLDPEVYAITGPMYYHDTPAQSMVRIIDRWIRIGINRFSSKAILLAGANMAIRRSVWQQVRHDLCADTDLYEDIDLAIHVQKKWPLSFNPDMIIGTSARKLALSMTGFYDYLNRSYLTYARHGIKAYSFKLPVIALVPLHPIMKASYLLYNAEPSQMAIRRIQQLFEY